MGKRRAMVLIMAVGVAAAGGFTAAPLQAAAGVNPTFQLVGFYDESGTKVDKLEQGRTVHAEFTVTNGNAFPITFTDLAPAVTAVSAGCAGSLKVVKPADFKNVVVPASGTGEAVKDSTYTLNGPCQATELSFAVNKYWWASYSGPAPSRQPASDSASPTPTKSSASQVLPPEPEQRQRATPAAAPAGEPSGPALPVWMIGILACAGVLVVAGVLLYLAVQFEDLRRRR